MGGRRKPAGADGDAPFGCALACLTHLRVRPQQRSCPQPASPGGPRERGGPRASRSPSRGAHAAPRPLLRRPRLSTERRSRRISSSPSSLRAPRVLCSTARVGGWAISGCEVAAGGRACGSRASVHHRTFAPTIEGQYCIVCACSHVSGAGQGCLNQRAIEHTLHHLPGRGHVQARVLLARRAARGPQASWRKRLHARPLLAGGARGRAASLLNVRLVDVCGRDDAARVVRVERLQRKRGRSARSRKGRAHGAVECMERERAGELRTSPGA